MLARAVFGTLVRRINPIQPASARRLCSEAAQAAKPKKKGRWGLKLVSAGVVVIVGNYAVDAGLHPRPRKEVVEDLKLKVDLKNRKERVVVLGTGWGAVACMRNLDPFKYEIVCVSPRNYFVMTPLLPSVTVGTVEPRTVVESIRNVCPHVKFVEAECTGLDHLKKMVVVTPTDEKMTSSSRAIKDSTRTRPQFEITYDKLVVAVGAENNTFGTPGVYEHAHFLKEIVDARRIRAAVIDAFESACNPAQSEAERNRLLNFVVVGGGPTGVEFAAELADLVHQDLQGSFPQLKNQVKIQLVEAMETVLSMFDKRISEYTEQNFKREDIDVLSNTFVKEVKEKEIIIQRKGSKIMESVPCSLVVWATGIKCRPIVNKLREAIGLKTQNNFRALITDEFLEVKGAKDVYSLGDCATIEQKKLSANIEAMFAEADIDKDGGVSLSEFKTWTERRVHEYPQLQFLANTDQMAEKFKKYAGRGADPKLKLEQFKQVCNEADRTMKTLPATAQVAAQEGMYLGKRLSCMPTAHEEASVLNSLKKQWLALLGAADLGKPFQYMHMGSLAYIGADSAGADLTGAKGLGIMNQLMDALQLNVMSGKGTFLLWRSFYFSEQCSTRTKLLLLFDWAKAMTFGRDVSRY